MTAAADPKPAEDTAKVFLSYSRKDRERAQSIADVLRERHFGVFKDTDDILPTEEWKGRLEQLIAEADTVVFLLSPHSLASEVCAWEVEHARALNKRIAPIVISEVESGQIPPDLARLNFIFCTERDRFQDAVDNLVSALSTDIDWIREHTRLGELAQRWQAANRPSRLLLRGQDIADAERWRDERPEEAPAVTSLQAGFIAASRTAASRRQQIAVVSSIVGLIIALGLAAFAYVQREAAVENAIIAAENEAQARQAQSLAEEQRSAAQVNQSLLLTRFADQELKRWLPVEAALLALEAIPDARSRDPLIRDRPLVDEAQVMLRKALDAQAEHRILLSDLPDSRYAISPDGRWISVHAPGQKTLHVLDLSGETPPAHVTSNLIVGTPKVPGFSPDSSQIVIAAGQGKVLVLPTAQPKDMRSFQIGDDYVKQVAFLNGGMEVLAVDQDDTALIIDLASGDTVFRDTASVIAVTSDAARFALYHDNRIAIHVAEDKRRLGVSPGSLSDTGAVVKRMTFNADGRFLAAATEHRTFVVQGDTADFLARSGQKDQSLMGYGFDPSGDWHFVSGVDGKTVIYDLNSLSKVVEHTGQRGWIFDVSIARDQQAVLTASSDGNVQLWSPQTNKNLTWLRGHTDIVMQAQLLDDGSALTISEDGTLRLWDVAKWLPNGVNPDRETRIQGYAGEAIYTRDRGIVALSEAGVFHVESGAPVEIERKPGFTSAFKRFSDDGRWLMAELRSEMNGDVANACLYDMTDGKIARCVLADESGGIFDADVDAKASLLTYKEIIGDAYDRHFVVVDARSGAELGRKIEAYPTPYETAVIGPDGKRLFLQNKNHRIDVFDTELQPLSSFGPDEGGVRLKYSDDRTLVAFIWPAAGVLEVWDTRTGTRLSRIETPYPDNDATVFSPSGKYLAAILSSTELAIYDAKAGTRVAQVQIKGGAYLRQPVFSEDETLLATHMEDRIAILDLSNGRTITEFKMDFRGYAPLTFAKKFTQANDALIAWSWDGPTRFALMRSTQEVLESAQAQLPRCLSTGQRKRFYLPPAPPRWCITGPGQQDGPSDAWLPKFPYAAATWRDWQIAVDAGETPVLPE